MTNGLPSGEGQASAVGAARGWKAVAFWFALTLMISWSVWVPRVLSGDRGHSSEGLLGWVAIFGPTLAAIAVVTIESGWRGLRDLLRGLTVWRVGAAWYLIALLLPSVLGLLALAIEAALGGGWHGLGRWADWSWYPLGFLVVLLGGPLGVEVGVRGFAQGRFQAMGCNALVASLLAGACHAIWHLPTLAPGMSEAGLPVGWFTLMVLALGVLFGWIYNNTRGSILLAVLFHGGGNVAVGRLPLFQPGAGPAGLRPFYLLVALFTAVAIAVTLVAGAERLSRKPAHQL